ncbi:hypothetical protein TRAPUB_2664 [Trametes pubescens]|uniref:Uncharacterized protein n=1 Tax=Trametes pubescens TaxID=154538 RepID=A0A1M2VFY5_TRAPU|nr:hypothetical protein TRAPUB_2664 [Trametes pubescens]
MARCGSGLRALHFDHLRITRDDLKSYSERRARTNPLPCSPSIEVLRVDHAETDCGQSSDSEGPRLSKCAMLVAKLFPNIDTKKSRTAERNPLRKEAVWNKVLEHVNLVLPRKKTVLRGTLVALRNKQSAEAAIALAYPEPYNQGKFLGFWLTFRVFGQLIGGAVNLGLNSKNGHAGKVSYTVYIVFIVLQSLAPFAGLLLTPPKKVERSDGRAVKLEIQGSTKSELLATVKLFCTREFLLIVPLIAQAVFSEAVMFTYLSLWFSVRARALGSFLSAIVALTGGNLLGWFLDNKTVKLKLRARGAFFFILAMQGGWWIWSTILTTRFNRTKPTFDWGDEGFGSAFTLFLVLVLSFQVQYLYLYFVVGHLARTPEEVVRIAGLLRGTESAAQAVSYGLSSVSSFAAVGASAVNFGLWGVALVPAWLVIRDIGGRLGDRREERERAVQHEDDVGTEKSINEKVPV